MVESGEIYSRCSPSRVYSVMSLLSLEKKEIVRQMGFGSLLGMKKCNLRRELITWLIERFDPIEGSLYIGNEKYILSSQIFGKTLGVEDGGEEVGELIMDDCLKRVMGDRTSICRLEETLKNNGEEHLFVRNFLQFVCGSFLLPSTSLYVVRSLEESLNDINEAKVARSKNWASLCWRYLVEGVRRYKERRSQFVCGCVYFFQLYYLNELEGHNRYVDKSIVPSNWWTEKDIRHVFDWINECGGFDKVSVKKRTIDKDGLLNPRNDSVSMVGSGSEDMISEVREMRTEIELLRAEVRDNVSGKFCSSCRQSLCALIEMNDGHAETIYGVEQNSIALADHQSNNIVISKLTVSESYRSMYERYIGSGGKVVGQFQLSHSIDLSYFITAMHIFQTDLSLSDVLYRHRDYEVVRLYFGTLLPKSKVDLQLVGAFVTMIKYEELLKYQHGGTCSVVTMPLKKRNGCLVDIEKVRQDKHDIPLNRCAKIVVPILDFDDDHWYLADFNKNENRCGIWDSVGVGSRNLSRQRVIKELASFLDQEISKIENKSSYVWQLYSDMQVANIELLQLQDNSTDCGVFVMKFIEFSVSCNKVMPQFDPSAERLHIALKMIMSVTNDVCGDVLSDARRHFSSLSTTAPRMGGEVLKPHSRVRSPISLVVDADFLTKKQRAAYWCRGRRRCATTRAAQ